MEQVDIDRIELSLETKFPDRHAQFLRNYAFSDPQDFLIVDADPMISENRGERDHDGWDSNFLIVGNDGCGNPLCLRLSPPSDEHWICEYDPTEGFSVYMARQELKKMYRTFES